MSGGRELWDKPQDAQSFGLRNLGSPRAWPVGIDDALPWIWLVNCIDAVGLRFNSNTGKITPNVYAAALKSGESYEVSESEAFADVPGLAINLIQAGTYLVSASLRLQAVDGEGGGGYKISVGGTATVANPYLDHEMVQQVDENGANTPAIVYKLGTTYWGDAGWQAFSGPRAGTWRISSVLDVTEGGTVLIRFAQNTSAAGPSVVGSGSWIRAERIA